MNRNEKVYYVYVENGKAVITEEVPDFDKVHNYMLVKADGIELFMGVHKNQDDLMLPDKPIDVATMLIDAEVSANLGDKGTLTCPKYDSNQLREIAEHLLAYCNAQERGCVDACGKNYKSESV